MKKLSLITMITLVALQLAVAQNRPNQKTDREAFKAEIAEAKKQMQEPVNALLAVSNVGEPDSFGKNVVFLGTALTGTVYSYYSRDPAVLQSELGLALGMRVSVRNIRFGQFQYATRLTGN